MSSCRKAVRAESSCDGEFPGATPASSLPGSGMKLTLAVPELGPSSPIEPPTAPSISPDETASGEPLERAL